MESNLKEQYEDEFIRIQKPLTSFIYRLVTNKEDTKDLVQETYMKVVKNLSAFEGRSSFKTWVFAIATNLCKDFLKSQSRWTEDYQDNCRTATYASSQIQKEMADIVQNSPHGKFVIKEHIDYCFTCISKTLLLKDQVCLLLKELYAFKLTEIAEIMNLSIDQVKHSLAGSRKKLEVIFEKRCALINKQGMCHQCSELMGMLNPRQKAEEEIMKLKLVKERDTKDYKKLLELRIKLAKSIDPIHTEGFDLHNYMLENLPKHSK